MTSLPCCAGADAPGSTREAVFGTQFVYSESNKFAANNSISTTRYSFLTFIPKSLFEQFRRGANVYFLFMAVLMVLGENFPDFFETPYASYTVTSSLSIVIGLTMLKEGFEDRKRYRKDVATNARRARVLDDSGNFVDCKWSEVRVGQIVRVQDREEMPADLILLTSTSPEGGCYVETSNIDGETNLKIREAAPALIPHCRSYGHPDPLKLMEFGGKMFFEPPNKNIHTFVGRLEIDGAENPVPVGPKQFLLRGSQLRNTPWIWGLVVYTGPESKVMKNSHLTPSKLSNLESTINKCILFVLATQLILCALGGIAACVWASDSSAIEAKQLATETSSENPWDSWHSQFFTFIVLFNNFLPISLYVTVETVLIFQAAFMEYDVKMYDPVSDTAASVRTSNLNSDFGQVDYVFSDKTGTLTQNVMKFKQCSIGGVIYGDDDASPWEGDDLPALPSETAFSDRRLFDVLRSDDEETAQMPQEFVRCLALCHTVVVEHLEDGSMVYQAESPDEGALVHGAKPLGFELTNRAASEILITDPRGEEVSYELLAVNGFDSTRKRMSVIVRTPAGEIVLYCKGADNKMIERLDPDQNAQEDIATMEAHLTQFARVGLRTLVMGKRILSDDEYAAWRSTYDDALNSIEDRDGKLAACAHEIESGLVAIGASAIEDKLQDGVPDTIFNLRAAGIRVWVLTGDKAETAKNIGKSCRLLLPHMQIIEIAKDDPKELDVLLTHWITALGHIAKKSSLFQRLLNTTREAGIAIARMFSGGKHEELEHIRAESLALLVHGATSLVHILEDKSLTRKFLQLGRSCKSVIACRVSPSQKAAIVAMVKQGVTPTPVTLAIGDGANDVSMIQEAHLGVGISGKEGLQAVNSSDVAIAQFRFLKRLLLVHGRWNYRRLSMVVLYSFYKNICLTTTILLFQFFCGWSGQAVYEEIVYTVFNFVLGFPILFVGIFDKDIEDTTAEKYPASYRVGRLNLDLNPKKIMYWIWMAVFTGAVVFFLPFMSWYSDADSGAPYTTWAENGESDGLLVLGTITYIGLIWCMNIKLLMIMHTWNVLTTALAIGFGSILFFYCSMFLYNSELLFNQGWIPFFNVFGMVFIHRPIGWFILMLVVAAVVMVELVSTSLVRQTDRVTLQLMALDHNLNPGHTLVPVQRKAKTNSESPGDGAGQATDSGDVELVAQHSLSSLNSVGEAGESPESKLVDQSNAQSLRQRSHTRMISSADLQILGESLSVNQRREMGITPGSLNTYRGFDFSHPQTSMGVGAGGGRGARAASVASSENSGAEALLQRSSDVGAHAGESKQAGLENTIPVAVHDVSAPAEEKKVANGE